MHNYNLEDIFRSLIVILIFVIEVYVKLKSDAYLVPTNVQKS